jgi:hypothetical protein
MWSNLKELRSFFLAGVATLAISFCDMDGRAATMERSKILY